MSLDEFEAIRLADLDGLYQEQAAEQMRASPVRRSAGSSSRRTGKLADVLVHGKALRIEGGSVQVEGRQCCLLHDAITQSTEEK